MTGAHRPLDDFGPRSWARPEVTGFNRVPMATPLARQLALDLDGAWAFVLRSRPEDVTHDDLVGPTVGWTSIEVPSSWTMQDVGDHPRYTNVQMPFEGPPPRVPLQNPTGVHRRTITLPTSWTDHRIVLHVGAAESVLYVHVDGTPVAMGKDSRLPHEIDLSASVTPGVPFELALTVVRWSDATYLEDQDHWHHAGLHRSVYLYATPKIYVADVHTTADFDPVTGDGSLHTVVHIGSDDYLPRGWTVRVTVAGEPVTAKCSAERPDDVTFNWLFFAGRRGVTDHVVPGASPWSAETPTLYPVEVVLVDEQGADHDTVALHVGFRRVELSGHELRVNGEVVLIKGVNRHDHDPRRGKAVTRPGMEAELVLMKQHNINAIRTSHYPNDPYLYDLADQLGFYVVGEANLEAHAYLRSLTKDPRWGQAIHERITRHALRDKNHPSIILWSLGNESGGAPVLAAAATWLREWDPSRPVQYESVITEAMFSTYAAGDRATMPEILARPATTSDVIAPMYPSVEDIVDWATTQDPDRPLIMCEYSFAMGNSNGGLTEYWDAIRTHPGLQGGFVWVWRDQGLVQQLPDGTERIAYGGDFDDLPHDGRFLLCGIVGTHLDPHPALLEIAAVYAPVRIGPLEASGTVRITNEHAFVDLAWLTPVWVLEVDGEVVEEGTLAALPVPAGESATVSLPMATPPLAAGQRADLTLSFVMSEGCSWAPAGHTIASRQFLVAAGDGPSVAPSTGEASDIVGLDPVLSMWRAPIDNESINTSGEPKAATWDELGLREAQASIHLDTDTVDGLTTHTVEVPEGFDDLPRVGVRLALGNGVHTVEWLGDGPHEGYCDRRSSTRFGRWTTPVDDWSTAYAYPQSSGNRTGVRWLRFLDAHGNEVLAIDHLDGLDVTVSRWTDEEVDAASHRDELPPSEGCYVWIDARHRGVGTGSLGPDVAPRHRFGAGTYRWSYRVRRPTAAPVAVGS